MKITYNWLREYIDIKGGPDQLDEILTDLGLEVEGIEPTLAEFDKVVVGKVIAKDAHPEADRLSLCTVDAGQDKALTIVCGAPNVDIGHTVPVALSYAKLPFGELKPRKIRGIPSEGMICSEEELGFADKSEGIFVLDESKYEVGKDFRSYFEEDYVIELSIGPNRPDCLGLFGILREISISTGLPFRYESPSLVTKPLKEYDIQIEDPQGCPRYVGVLIEGVKIGPSPDWLCQLLHKLGLRPINQVVDLTNYLMLLYGQPMHAFDADTIAGKTIVVRNATPGEKLTTLDEVERSFLADDLLICDKDRASAIAGVMGGGDSEITPETKNVFLEVAYFDPIRIRKTSKRQKMHTDASHRFERGMNPDAPLEVAHAATEHILKLAGGTYCGTLDRYVNVQKNHEISYPYHLGERILGVRLENSWTKDTLEKLGCEVLSEDDSSLQVKIPLSRPDLERPIDLVEELARLHGYNEIPFEPPSVRLHLRHEKTWDTLFERTRSILVSQGLSECVTYSFSGEEYEAGIPLLNPIAEDLSYLRTNLKDRLIDCALFNFKQQNLELGLFEIGKIFKKVGDSYEEEVHLALAISGTRLQDWKDKGSSLDFFDTRGLLETLFSHLNLNFNLKECKVLPRFMDGLQTQDILFRGKPVGFCGLVDSRILRKEKAFQDLGIIEINLQSLLNLELPEPKFKEIPNVAAANKQLALITPLEVHYEQVAKVIRSLKLKDLEDYFVFDLYKGKEIPEGKKSLGVQFVFRGKDRSLSEEEMGTQIHKILNALEKSHGITLRP